MNDSPDIIESCSPQAPSDLVVRTAASTRSGVARAFAASRRAATSWARTPASERAGALIAAADSLAAAARELEALIVREVGKPLREAQGEVARAVSILRFHGQAALLADGETHPPLPPMGTSALVMSRHRPRGVAGLITPWNFPIAIPLWKASPALAYGNAVVLKPSPEATATGIRMGEIVGRHLPLGVLAILPGGRETGEAVVAEADVVSFTGSTAVGRLVAKAAAVRGTAVQCEMGGLNASIVLPDAEPEATARVVASSMMSYAGQKCTATSRVIVLGDPTEFTDALVAAVEDLTIGDPRDLDTVVGPVISRAARDAVLGAARAEGRVLSGAAITPAAGFYVTPTLVDSLGLDSQLAREEVFGPVAAVLPVSNRDAAVALNAAARHGLVTSVFTTDLDTALWFTDRIGTGMIRINQPTTGVDFHAPFGGEGDSSYGPREQGLAAREHYTTLHTISISPSAAMIHSHPSPQVMPKVDHRPPIGSAIVGCRRRSAR